MSAQHVVAAAGAGGVTTEGCPFWGVKKHVISATVFELKGVDQPDLY